MDFKNTLERINYFEELLPINQMELLGINIWPILRTFYVTSNDKNNFSKTKFTINKLKIFDFNLKKIKSHDLFFSYANDPSGTIKLDNKYIQKQAFVLKKYKSNNLKTIEFGLPNDSNKRDSFQITGLYVFFKIFYFFNYKKKKILKLELTNLKERINSDLIKYDISFCENEIKEFFCRKYFFDLLLNYLKTKSIYLKSFNNINAFAICASSKDLNIETYEYQHGQQGEYSLAYSSWKNIPKTGYSMLPKVFLLWDSIFSVKFEKWISNQDYHRLEIVENFWFKYVNTNSYLFPKITIDNDYINVVVCLQSLKIPESVIELLNNEDSLKWHFRLHPKDLGKIEIFKKTLNQIGINPLKVDLITTNQTPIESVLKSFNTFITEWSTVAYEAYLNEKKSIVIGNKGYNAYHFFIKGGGILFAENSKDLLKYLISK